MQFSSREAKKDAFPHALVNPLGEVVRRYRTAHDAQEAEARSLLGALRWDSRDRTRKQTNPTNRILVDFRLALKAYADKRLAITHYLDYVRGEVYGWTRDEKAHAERVLWRLWSIGAPYVDFEDGKSYWIKFRDGSRIKVEAFADSRGNIDVENERLDFSMWVGSKGDPRNRENIERIREAV